MLPQMRYVCVKSSLYDHVWCTSVNFFRLYNIKQIPKTLQSKWQFSNPSSKWESANTSPKLTQKIMLRQIVLGLIRCRNLTCSRPILKQATIAVMISYLKPSKASRHDYNILWHINEAKSYLSSFWRKHLTRATLFLLFHSFPSHMPHLLPHFELTFSFYLLLHVLPPK